MIECRTLLESLSALIDRELDEGQRRTILEHLASCSACQQEYESLRHAKQVTDQLTVLEPNPFLWTRIQSHIASLPPPRSYWPWQLLSWLRSRWAPITAGVLGGILATVFLFQPGQVEAEQEFRVYVQEREQIEIRHGDVLQNPRQEVVPVIYLNPFRRDDRPFRSNPFQSK